MKLRAIKSVISYNRSAEYFSKHRLQIIFKFYYFITILDSYKKGEHFDVIGNLHKQ